MSRRHRSQRRIPSGVDGINWLSPSAAPRHALTVTFADGTLLRLDSWEIASAATLLRLWAGEGVFSLPTAGWRLAQHDIAYGFEWRLHLAGDMSRDELLFSLHDTRTTEPPRVAVVDVTTASDGDLQTRTREVVAPQPGLSGDPTTDMHLAILLAMLRENGGGLTACASTFIQTATIIRSGHQWRAIPGIGDSERQMFYLEQPAGPPGPSGPQRCVW